MTSFLISMFKGTADDGVQLEAPRKIGHYVTERIVGHGSSAVIVVARHEATRQLFAIKAINRHNLCPKQINRLQQEVFLAGTLSHPSIVHFEEIIETRTHICIVMEYCGGGDLLSLLMDRSPSTVELKQIFKQILEGVQYLHGLGFTHGDIKPENIVLTSSGAAKLIDFGYSSKTGVGSEENRIGTLTYAAPELFKRASFDTEKVDIWALGILMLVMFTRKMPYYDGSTKDIVRQICRHGIVYPKRIDPDLHALIERMTALMASIRPTVRDIMSDAFFDEPKVQITNFPSNILSQQLEELGDIQIAAQW
jgi:5'-AMP-activated protein kinase catalytic alpha subunit